METIINQFEQALASVNRQAAHDILTKAAGSYDQYQLMEGVITSALERIGQKWETGEVALSQVYMSGIICEELIHDLFFQDSASLSSPASVAVVVFEDHHALGKRIVQSVLRANGINALDYGQGLQADELVRKIQHDGIKVLLISTLMFPSALHIKALRNKLDDSGLKVKIGVGGAPFRFDDNLWKQVGADAMGRTAADALQITRRLLEECP